MPGAVTVSAAVAAALLLLCGRACLAQPQPSQTILSVRLRDQILDNATYSGILEATFDGWQWKSVIRNTDSGLILPQVGNIACRSLGYGLYQKSIFDGAYYYYYASGSSGQIFVDDIGCSGNELSIRNCSYIFPVYYRYIYLARELRIYCSRSKCNDDNGGCSQLCNDNYGGATETICSCLSGYVLHEINKTLCIDVNECEANETVCTHGCVNTVGSYHCTCPTYMIWNETSRTCTERGFRIICHDNWMQAAFTKDVYPMLSHESVALVDRNCFPEDNGTHIVFSIFYKDCLTKKSEDSESTTYTNAVIDIDTQKGGQSVKFSSGTNIQFSCVISKNSSSSFTMKTQPTKYTTSPVGLGGINFTIKICPDLSCEGDTVSSPVKESFHLYARLEMHTLDYDISFQVKKCIVYPDVELHGEVQNPFLVDLIVNGTPAVAWVKIPKGNESAKYTFQYPAFNFVGSQMQLALECQVQLFTSFSPEIRTSSTNSTMIIASNSTSAAYNSSVASAQTRAQLLTANVGVNQTTNPVPQKLVSSCGDATSDGMYKLVIGNQIVNVWCDVTSSDGPWLVVMRRYNGRLDFKKTWREYESGFGNLDGEFWFGNSLLYNITKNLDVSLRITLTTFSNRTAFADYSDVQFGSAASAYSLKLGGYKGTAGDIRNISGCLGSINVTEPVRFSTYDKDNDGIPERNCAERGGGWWYFDCICTCLTCGPSSSIQALSRSGMIYYQFNNLYVLKKAEIRIKIGSFTKAFSNSVKVGGSSVVCSSAGMTVTLDKDVYDLPTLSFGAFTVQGDSFVSQSTDDAHATFNFNLRAMDTVRQENHTTISYVKRVAIIPSSNLTYYSRIEILSQCHLSKMITVKTTYQVQPSSANFEAAEQGKYQVKLNMFKDDQLKEILEDASTAPEGQPLYVKATLEHGQPDLKLAVTSCFAGIYGADSSMNYQLIRDRCPVPRDVKILARDTFFMRIAASMRNARGTRVYCDVQVCTAEEQSCDDVCNESPRRSRRSWRQHSTSKMRAMSAYLS